MRCEILIHLTVSVCDDLKCDSLAVVKEGQTAYENDWSY